MSTLNNPAPQQPQLGHSVKAGFLIVALFLGGFVGWSLLAPLDSAAVASGTVTVDKGRKTLAHLEGGIVGELLVEEGQKVKAGQLLIRLSGTNALATLDLLRSRQYVAHALVARLESEYNSRNTVEFPQHLLAKRSEATVAEILQVQDDIFATRRDALASRKGIFQQRIVQLQEEITGLQGQVASASGQLKLLREEINMIQILVNKGISDKPRLLSLQRRAHEVEGRRSKHLSDIARAEQSIGETRLRIADIDTAHINEVAEQLRTTRAEIYDLNERLRAAEDVYQRTNIISPIDGTVVGLEVHTPGGVIRPGEPLMHVVPDNERLLVEARVAPSDIDVVYAGMQAEVRLTAFNQRYAHPTRGKVESVSAGHLVDEHSGETYYLARIALPTEDAAQHPDQLRPGMEAEVMIVTGERTFMQYLLEPLSKSVNRSFNEA